MTLRDRLNHLYGPAPKKTDLRRRLEKIHQPPVFHSLDEFLGGSWRERSSGRLLVVERDFPDFHRHGDYALEEVYSIDGSSVALLAGSPSLAECGAETGLFLDTETTGLAGGAGTCAFLIGAAYFEQDRFHIRQLFLPDFESEHAFLEEFSDLVQQRMSRQGFCHLVSFNGKRFDMNLLENRFVLQRLENPCRSLGHLDLLYPSRALWKGQFEDCALQTLERHLLGLRREDDIPSALIPQTYFNYIHWGEYGALREVLHHNRLDLLSLVTLLAVAGRLIREPDRRSFVDPLAAARFHTLRGQCQAAASLLEGALQQEEWEAERPRLLLELARLKKKLGETDHSLQLCQELIRTHRHPPLEAFEEAAKTLEHQKRAFEPALEVVLQGLQVYHRSAALERRQFRLRCRIEGKKWY